VVFNLFHKAASVRQVTLYLHLCSKHQHSRPSQQMQIPLGALATIAHRKHILKSLQMRIEVWIGPWDSKA